MGTRGKGKVQRKNPSDTGRAVKKDHRCKKDIGERTTRREESEGD